jgi:general secretion pathway protein D
MKKSLTALTILLLGATGQAHAQFDFQDTAPPKPAWELFKLSPKTRMKLDFRNASIDAVLQLFSQTSGIAIIKDPTLVGAVTLQSPKDQSLSDAFAMLNAVLGLKNFDLKKEGSFLVIRAKTQRGGGSFGGQNGGGQRGGFGGGGFPSFGGPTANIDVKVYALKYASATQVARVINDVFANAGQQAPFPAPGIGGGAPLTIPAPTGASASRSDRALTQTEIAAQFGGGGFGGQRGGFGGGGFGGGGLGGGGQRGGFGGFGGGGFGGGRNNSTVRASADDYSNSVIVNAPLKEQNQVSDLIDQIDKQTDQPQQSRVFKLNYALASELAPVIQNVLVSNAPRGRGGTSTTQGQGGGGFGGFGGGFGDLEASVADETTLKWSPSNGPTRWW